MLTQEEESRGSWTQMSKKISLNLRGHGEKRSEIYPNRSFRLIVNIRWTDSVSKEKVSPNEALWERRVKSKSQDWSWVESGGELATPYINENYNQDHNGDPRAEREGRMTLSRLKTFGTERVELDLKKSWCTTEPVRRCKVVDPWPT